MAATQTEEEQVPLKLVVNKETNNVIFAEAGKDFVDVLFSFLTFPLGTIARLMQKESDLGPVRVGCLDSLYKSVSMVDKEFQWRCKEMLIKPTNSSEDYCRSLKLNIDDTESSKNFIYMNVLECSHNTSDDNICNGFVKDFATFIITDDLIVMPISIDATIDMLQNSGIKTVCSIQKTTVYVTKEKVLDLLKCCLLSKSSLTDLFLKQKPFLECFTCSHFLVLSNNSGMNIQTNVKLIVTKSDGRVLFAQAEKPFVDLILSILTLPLGRVIHMLGGNSSLGCIDGLYKSIVDLDENKYLMSEEVKHRLVNADVAPQFRSRSHFGLVKPTIFNVLDELHILPVARFSTASFLIELDVPLCEFKEKIVTIGVKEGLSILKASLTSRCALTNGLAHLLT